MQAPRLPSIFRSPKIRRFSFPVRYYDARKERIENLNKGKYPFWECGLNKIQSFSAYHKNKPYYV